MFFVHSFVERQHNDFDKNEDEKSITEKNISLSSISNYAYDYNKSMSNKELAKFILLQKVFTSNKNLSS